MQYLNTTELILPVMTAIGKIANPRIAKDSTHPVLALQSQNINIANAGIGVT